MWKPKSGRPEVTIGRSEQGRPLRVFWAGEPDTSTALRVLIVAGQHGDETLATAAAIEAIERLRSGQRGAAEPCASTTVALLPTANPDGAAAGVRHNARGVDLNRDHLRLLSAEIRALHGFVRAWCPHLVLDVHTYPPRRRHLLTQNLVYCHDVFLDVPNHPAVRLPISGDELGELLRGACASLSGRGIRSARYTLIRRSGRVRHGTPDIVDARNALALRFGVPVILVEGRQPTHDEDSPAARRQACSGIGAAIDEILGWAGLNAHRLAQQSPESCPGDRVVVASRYVDRGEQLTMNFAPATGGGSRPVTLPGPYTPTLEPGAEVMLPLAYAVPCSRRPLLALLERHAFAVRRLSGGDRFVTEAYRIEAATPSRRVDRTPHDVRLSVVPGPSRLPDHVLLPVQHSAGAALAVLLEPHAKHGLARLAEMDLTLVPGQGYPILRVVG